MGKFVKFIFLIIFFGVLVPFISVTADTLDQNQHFFVDQKYALNGVTGVDATLKHISDKAYFYIENGYWNSLSLADQADLISKIVRRGSSSTPGFGSEPKAAVSSG